MGQYVMMPIWCIGKTCSGCPELEIEVDTNAISAGAEVVIYENTLKCAHANRCERLYRNFKKEICKEVERETKSRTGAEETIEQAEK